MNVVVSNESSLGDPREKVLFLLGGMDAKLDNVVREQSAARIEAAEFRSEVRSEIASVKTELSVVKSEVDVLKSKQIPKTPWFVVAGGLAGIGSIVLAVITLIGFVNIINTL